MKRPTRLFWYMIRTPTIGPTVMAIVTKVRISRTLSISFSPFLFQK